LEFVSNLTTKAFIAALWWFMSWIERFLNLYSDNATNFTTAINQIREVYQFDSFEKNGKSMQRFWKHRSHEALHSTYCSTFWQTAEGQCQVNNISFNPHSRQFICQLQEDVYTALPNWGLSQF
jgi:hypothetical protein